MLILQTFYATKLLFNLHVCLSVSVNEFVGLSSPNCIERLIPSPIDNIPIEMLINNMIGWLKVSCMVGCENFKLLTVHVLTRRYSVQMQMQMQILSKVSKF